MSIQRLLVVLTVVNVALLAFSLAQSRTVPVQGVAPVLRGHALEIVDDRGRVRASIAVLPANPGVRMPDGTTGYPETVLLRLISSDGGPHVKLAATEDGSALVLGGESDPTYVQLLARGVSTSLRLSDKNGHEQLIKP
jgi:hypothetical protein